MTNNNLHKNDIIRQGITPTIMMPKESPIEPCDPGKMRFLMGSDGLYLDAATNWARFTARLWKSTRKFPLPYGQVEEHDGFSGVLHDHVMPLIGSSMLKEAAMYAERKQEWAGFILWDGQDFVPHQLPMKTSTLAVEFHDDAMSSIPEGHEIVADIHSHHVMQPVFSAADNESDSGRIKIAIVLGNYRISAGAPAFDWVARYCVHGFFFDPSENE